MPTQLPPAFVAVHAQVGSSVSRSTSGRSDLRVVAVLVAVRHRSWLSAPGRRGHNTQQL